MSTAPANRTWSRPTTAPTASASSSATHTRPCANAIHLGRATRPAAGAAGHPSGDAKPDLVTANFAASGTVSVLLGNGNGSFAPAVNYAVGAFPIAVALADVNGDGKP